MDVTLAICTRNRASLLDKTLAAIGHLRIPDGLNWEIVVVNNNSTDKTDDAILRHAKLLPVRRQFEAALGVANARNRAVSAAQGTYIIWLDDDVIVDQELLCAYLDAFRQYPKVTLFGGKVIPQLEEPVPLWIKETWETVPIVRTLFAFRDYGNDPVSLSLVPRRTPVSANCAIRTAVQKDYAYNPILGPRPVEPNISGEDSYLYEALLKDGHTGYWVPRAVVTHCIPRSRQTMRALRRHCLAFGRGDAFRDQNSSAVRLVGVPRWLWRRVLGNSLRYLFCRATSPQKIWLGCYVDYLQDLGALEYWLKLRHLPELRNSTTA